MTRDAREMPECLRDEAMALDVSMCVGAVDVGRIKDAGELRARIARSPFDTSEMTESVRVVASHRGVMLPEGFWWSMETA